MLSSLTPFVVQNIAQYPQAAALDTGHTYTGVVRVQNNALTAVIGSIQIPIGDESGLTSGQRISVLVANTNAGLQLTISPAATALAGNSATPQSPSASPPNLLAALLLPLLEALDKLDRAPQIARILPRVLPATPAALQPLLETLFSGRALSRDLQQLQQILSAAVTRGGLPNDTASAIAQWLGLAPTAESAEWRGLLARTRAEQAVAARIAQSLQAGADRAPFTALKESAAALLDRLLSDPVFQQSLREEGEAESFKALSQRFHERATGSDVQNLRSLGQAYQFIDLPVLETQGMLRAHVHAFRDETSQGGKSGAPAHRTVLDLETTRLGALWVTLQSIGTQCACHFRTEIPEIAALLETEAPQLQESLAAAGYPNATISAALWKGDREEALIAMLAPYQKLDMEV